jgi:hypothetical protein
LKEKLFDLIIKKEKKSKLQKSYKDQKYFFKEFNTKKSYLLYSNAIN